MTETATRNIVGLPITWITVKDLKKALDFYVNVVGLEIVEKHWEFRWAELKGPEGGRLGIAQEGPLNPFEAGNGAVMIIQVLDIEKAYADVKKREDLTFICDIKDYPGHARLFDIRDSDGNLMQFVEKLD